MPRLSISSNSISGLIEDVNISKIHPPLYCLRRVVDDRIDDLAKSIFQKGLLQPIIARIQEDHFEIVAGNRRYSVCKRLGWRKMLCHIVELADREAFEISLTENIQKKTLNPIDEALAFKTYIIDFGWGGISDLARKLGRSVSYVSRRINLLNLPSDVVDSIINCTIQPSIAEELLSISDKSKRSELAELVSKRKISLRRTRFIIRDLENEKSCVLGTPLPGIDYEFEKALKSFDKSIIALRIALNKLGSIIQQNDENGLIYEILMQHKNMLHSQIDLLIKHKKKYNCH